MGPQGQPRQGTSGRDPFRQGGGVAAAKSKPVSPSLTISSTPPCPEATTGTSIASASAAERPKLSGFFELETTTSLRA